MVTEPEAAAVYAARYLKEDAGHEFLKASFWNWLSNYYRLIHCTERRMFRALRRWWRHSGRVLMQQHPLPVITYIKDVASYKVTQLEPALELEPVTFPTG